MISFATLALKPGWVNAHDNQSQDELDDLGDSDDDHGLVVCDPLLVLNVPVKSQKSVYLCPANIKIERQSGGKFDDVTYFAKPRFMSKLTSYKVSQGQIEHHKTFINKSVEFKNMNGLQFVFVFLAKMAKY